MAFSFHRVENLLRNLILHFTLTLYLACLFGMKRRLTKNGRFIFHVFLILVCLLIHLLPIGIFLLKIQIMDTGERAS